MVENQDNKIDTGFGKRVTIEYVDFPISGTVLEIEAGKKTDMVFHRMDGRLLYLLAGKVRVSVLKDGVINGLTVQSGASFYVKPGLIYQLEGLEKSLVVEFGLKEDSENLVCISKGSQPAPAPQPEPVAPPAPAPDPEPAPVTPTEPEPIPEPVVEPVVVETPVQEPVKPVKRKYTRKKDKENN